MSQVTGKTAIQRNKAIDAIINEDFPNINFRQKPEYNPFSQTDIAQEGSGTQIGKKSFFSREELGRTIIHEELHHRWWERGIPSYHHSPDTYIPNEKFYDVINRYFRMRGGE